MIPAIYFVVAMGPKPATALEVFPFFNWSLFSSSSASRIDRVIIIKSINGAPLDEPTYFYNTKGIFRAADSKDSKLAKSVDRLAVARMTKNIAAEKAVRALIEQQYMNEVETVEYDVASIRYDPIVRFKTGEIDSTSIIASYRKGG